MSENDFDKALISDEEWSKVQISRLSSRPNAKTAYGSGGYDAKAMKEAFDAQGNLLKERHNELVNYARAEESARAAAETARDTAETVRNAAEDARVIAEIGAAGNWYDEYEGCVRDADGNIVSNENAGRVGADLKREYHSLQARAYEKLRKQSEEKRQANEGERQDKEGERQDKELERQAKEDTRERNENARIANENERITNEEVREKKMAIFEMLIGAIGSVADAILEEQERYIGGDG